MGILGINFLYQDYGFIIIPALLNYNYSCLLIGNLPSLMNLRDSPFASLLLPICSLIIISSSKYLQIVQE